MKKLFLPTSSILSNLPGKRSLLYSSRFKGNHLQGPKRFPFLRYGLIAGGVGVLGLGGAYWYLFDYAKDETTKAAARLWMKRLEKEEEEERLAIPEGKLENADEQFDEVVARMEVEDSLSEMGFIRKFFYYIFLGYRLCYIVARFTPAFVASFFCSKETYYAMIFNAMLACGPCFIKLGQWSASRPDLFDPYLCEVLGKFHYVGTEHSYKETVRLIEKAYGKRMVEIFDEFEEKPIGSGSIAQVYKAKLKGEDGYVAVKVRHPNVGAQIAIDVHLLQVVARCYEYLEDVQWMRLEKSVLDFARSMNAQVDLTFEGENLIKFRKNFEKVENVRFPEPFFFTPDILVETYEEVCGIRELINTEDTEAKAITARLGCMTFLQMLMDNFCHGDLHAGNVLVHFDELEDGSHRPNLVILDCGLVNVLSSQNRRDFLKLFCAFATDDSKTAAYYFMDQEFRQKIEFMSEEEKKHVQEFTDGIDSIIRNLNHSTEHTHKVGPSCQRLLQLGQEYRVPLESTFTALLIAAILVEGVGRELDPDVPFLTLSQDLLRHKTAQESSKFVSSYLRAARSSTNPLKKEE